MGLFKQSIGINRSYEESKRIIVFLFKYKKAVFQNTAFFVYTDTQKDPFTQLIMINC